MLGLIAGRYLVVFSRFLYAQCVMAAWPERLPEQCKKVGRTENVRLAKVCERDKLLVTCIKFLLKSMTIYF